MAQAVKILVRSALPSAVRNDGVQMHPVNESVDKPYFASL